MSQIDYNKNHTEMQDLYKEKYSDLALRVEKKNKSVERFRKVLTEQQYKRFEECGTFIGLSTEDIIIQANFCKLRACPVCNKRNSVKKWHFIKTIADEINQSIKPKWLFLTLTVQNVKAEELNKKIDDLMASLNRLFSRKTWQKRVLGFFRSLEITYNKKADTYHPHYHILLVVPEDYFTNKDLYLETWQWREMWETSANLNYHCQMKIEEIKATKEQELSGAIAEVAKYAVKMSEVAKVSQEALKHILKAIKGRRLISYGGIIHESYKDKKDGDTEFKTKAQAEREKGQVKYYQLKDGKYYNINC